MPLVYDGKPLRVPVSCTEEDIQSMGLSCSADSPCPVYLELSALEVLAGRMILVGNLHTDSATLSSIVLASEDGGKTWVESHPRIRQAALDQMQFFDLANGWISGQVMAALPRDPFFLVTIDGGKTWRQRPVFGDSHLGSIEKVSLHQRDRRAGAGGPGAIGRRGAVCIIGIKDRSGQLGDIADHGGGAGQSEIRPAGERGMAIACKPGDQGVSD